MICEEERIALIKKSLEEGVHLVMESGRKLAVVAPMPAMIADNTWIGVYLDTGEPVTLHQDEVVVDGAGDHDTIIGLWCYKKAEFKGWKHIHPEYTEVSVCLRGDGSMSAVFCSIRAQKETTILLCPKTVTNLSANPKTIVRP